MEKDKSSPQKHQEQKNYNTPIKLMKMVPHIFQSPSRPSFSQTADRQEGTTKGSPFKFINTFSTPPTGVSKVKNPFEGALMERLHLPMYSPSVFATVPNTNKTPDFRWTIEEMSELMPAQIDEHSNMQFEQIDEDPELEIKAQEKIERYFSEKHIVPSPWGVAVKNANVLPKTPQRCVQEKIKTATDKRDGITQTVLTFPSDIPPHIEELLKPFMKFTEDQQQSSSSDENLSNTSLYRKLFHNSPASVVSSEELEGDCQALSPIGLSLPPIKASNIGAIGRHFGSPSDQLLISSPDLNISPIKCSPIQIHRSTPSPHKKTDSDNKYCPVSLEDSPLSPISKMSMESVNSENSSLRNKQSQNTDEVKTNEFSALNDRNTSLLRLSPSNDLSMDISMGVVPESDNLPEPSNYSNLGTSLIHNEVGNCTYSSVNWDIENQTISKSVKRPRNEEFDNRVTSYTATDNVTSAMDTSISNTPRKSERKYSISKKLSSNFIDIEQQSFENVDKKWIVNINNLEDKENIAPLIVLSNKRVQLRRSFSDVPSGSKLSNFRCRDSKYYKEERFSKYRKCGSFSSTNDDSFIRDRSLLNPNRSDSSFDFKDEAFDNTFTFSQNTQDTGYGSNNGSESSSLHVTNILTATKISSDLTTNDSMFGANNSTSQNINKGALDQFNNCFASTPAKTSVVSSQDENNEKLYCM